MIKSYETTLGINAKTVYRNLAPAVLTEHALSKGEGQLSDRGALVIMNKKYTGRSPEDKYIVDTESVHSLIQWNSVNRPVSRQIFQSLKKDAIGHLEGKEIYVFDGFAGADKKHQRRFRIINELASQNLFISDLLIAPTPEELSSYVDPDFTILCVPGFKCDYLTLGLHSEAAIIIDYDAHYAVIAGTGYCGEIKKTVFSVMNFLLPTEDDILPMHCSANLDPATKETALFFGLSGTGKTTLSADPNRLLIGDDEHGWSDDGIFNIEGGCYAKCIDLTRGSEPEIYDAVRFGAVAENVILDPVKRTPDFSDRSITENTRVAYPIAYIPNSQVPGCGGIPTSIIFLTADAFGILPPVSRLDRNAAMYHFISGFTSKLAGTERGIVEPKPTFSSLFGEPFMPLSSETYASMLGERIDKYDTRVYLVNTGWSGGPYGTGRRISLRYTRAMITAILNGELKAADYVHNDMFNLDVPRRCSGVPADILDPRGTWSDKGEYDAKARFLAKMFIDNFSRNHPHMPAEIVNAGPSI